MMGGATLLPSKNITEESLLESRSGKIASLKEFKANPLLRKKVRTHSVSKANRLLGVFMSIIS
jgi:hypothetical protein